MVIIGIVVGSKGREEGEDTRVPSISSEFFLISELET